MLVPFRAISQFSSPYSGPGSLSTGGYGQSKGREENKAASSFITDKTPAELTKIYKNYGPVPPTAVQAISQFSFPLIVVSPLFRWYNVIPVE